MQLETETMLGSVIRRLSGSMLDSLVRMCRTRTNYWLEFVLDTGLGITFLVEGLQHHVRPLVAVLLIGLGLLLFSFMEYCFHRWMFHGSFRLMAQGHAAHHANPLGYDSLPFFFPAVALLTLIGAGDMVIPLGNTLLLVAGMAFGYVSYGLSHFMIHHIRFRQPLIRRWAAYHHIHHYHPNRNYGVTTPIWDVLLGTRYVSAQNLTRPRESFPS